MSCALTVRVDYREENKVVFVEEACDFGIVGGGQQVECQVFDDLSLG